MWRDAYCTPLACSAYHESRYPLKYGIIIIIIYSLKPSQVRKTYYIVYHIHTNVSQIRNITVYVLKAGK